MECRRNVDTTGGWSDDWRAKRRACTVASHVLAAKLLCQLNVNIPDGVGLLRLLMSVATPDVVHHTCIHAT